MNGSAITDTNTQVLEYMSETTAPVSSLIIASSLDIEHQRIVGAIKSISSTDAELLHYKTEFYHTLKLTEEGEVTLREGSLEARVCGLFSQKDSWTKDDIKNSFPNASIGLNVAVSLGWVTASTDNTFLRTAKEMTDTVPPRLKRLQSEDPVDDLIKRRLVVRNKVTHLVVERGLLFRKEVKKQMTDLTSAMIADGSWETCKLKGFNFDSLGVSPPMGSLHPLMKVRTAMRNIFLEMGFMEMETHRYVESSFWNFDALFQPQKHPARDMHDTFFVSSPEISPLPPGEYKDRVRDMHIAGYKSDWHVGEAYKNILRTHTTAVTARTLFELAQRNEFKPGKYFSIDRVFRNETLDATHLAEFHQIEGCVIDYDISLSDLIGLVTVFFNKLGITDLRFKAAYNPYTEPSMEIFHYHKQLEKLVEIGNSGMLRKEVLGPMGFPENVNCIAWGFSLERPTMILYEMTNIRDLVGHRVGLHDIKSNPICRFKDATQQ